MAGPSQQPQPMQQRFSPIAALNAFGWFVRIWAFPAEVLLHKQFGRHYIGLQAAAAVLLIPFYSALWIGYPCGHLGLLLPVYLIAVAIARIDILTRRKSNAAIHSHYSGYPRCLGKRAKMTELQCKQFFEPIFTAFIGLTLFLIGEAALGIFFIGSGVCLFISATLSEMQYERRAAAMNDQVLEQEYVAERFRAMQEGKL